MTTTSGTSGLTWRIFLGAAGVVAVVLVGTLLSPGPPSAAPPTPSSTAASPRTRELVVTFLQGDRRSLSQGAAVFVQNPNFRALLENPAPGDMLDQSIEAAHLLGATFVQITDAAGVRLARSDEPQAPPVSLSRSPLIAGALQGELRAGFGRDATLFQAVAVPIAGAGPGVVRGSLMAAPDDRQHTRQRGEASDRQRRGVLHPGFGGARPDSSIDARAQPGTLGLRRGVRGGGRRPGRRTNGGPRDA